MFTGIIEAIGKISALEKKQNGLGITIACSRNLRLHRGDSLAVDGVCLTCEKAAPREMSFTLSPETLNRSRFSLLKKGDKVNLERPLAANGRLGGHFVQGHVDGVGIVAGLQQDPPGWMLSIQLPEHLAQFCVEKGSIAVNGVSLTIATMRQNGIWIALIPYTCKHTSLGDLKPGDRVNIENDVVAKYVMKFMRPRENRAASEAFLWRFVKEGEDN